LLEQQRRHPGGHQQRFQRQIVRTAAFLEFGRLPELRLSGELQRQQ
jgi:hypothetical protein